MDKLQSQKVFIRITQSFYKNITKEYIRLEWIY